MRKQKRNIERNSKKEREREKEKEKERKKRYTGLGWKIYRTWRKFTSSRKSKKKNIVSKEKKERNRKKGAKTGDRQTEKYKKQNVSSSTETNN